MRALSLGESAPGLPDLARERRPTDLLAQIVVDVLERDVRKRRSRQDREHDRHSHEGGDAQRYHYHQASSPSGVANPPTFEGDRAAGHSGKYSPAK